MWLKILCVFILIIYICSSQNLCNISIDVSSGEETNEGIFHDGIYYLREHIFNEDGKTKACVCEYKTCLRKCCRVGKYFHTKKNKCIEGIKTINISLHNQSEEIFNHPFHLIKSKKWCQGSTYQLEPDKYETDVFKIQHKGHLIFPHDNEYIVNATKFCIDSTQEQDKLMVVVCNEAPPEEDVIETTLHNTGMMISLPFLVVTFLVYAFTPELRNLHGKCLMCYVMSLFVAYIFLIIVQIGKNIISKEFCTLAPLIIYFAFMVSFLWLNVMCIDIWWTFSGRRGFDIRRTEHKRFLIYSAYAWGISILMMSITAIMQFGDMPESVVTPRFGEGRCWFWNKQSTLYYFYGPIMFLIFSNLVLFGWTTFKIYQVKKETERSMRHDSQRHGDESDKQRFKLYLKLFLVFGVNWTMEIISFLAEGPSWTWYITDFCNALYGVFIFFIFVCKANVWKLAKKRYYSLMGRPYMAHSYAPTSDHTRSTTGAGPDSYAMTTETSTT